MAERHPVSQEELLRRMGISKEEFDKFKTDTYSYYSSLDEKEKEFYVKNNSRTAKEIARSLGEDVTVEDIECLFAGAPRAEAVYFVACCHT
jgi:hypothetical protein